MKNTHLVAGIVSGLAVGTILGMLFAPDKGNNTRRKIAKKGSSLKKSVKDSIDNLISSAENKIEQFSSKVDNIKNDVK